MGSRRLPFASLILFVAAWSVPSAAVDPSRLEINVNGNLVDEYNDPLRGVTVTLTGTQGEGAFSGTSGPNGEFRIEKLRPGLYDFAVSVEGFVFNTPEPGAPPLRVRVLEDGRFDPDLLSLIRQFQARRKGMWREILIFFGVVATGGVAAI